MPKTQETQIDIREELSMAGYPGIKVLLPHAVTEFVIGTSRLNFEFMEYNSPLSLFSHLSSG
jgi:hypothetical protein